MSARGPCLAQRDYHVLLNSFLPVFVPFILNALPNRRNKLSCPRYVPKPNVTSMT